MDPWSVKVVTPSESLIAHFDKWDMTKSNASKLRSFNRARKWISNLLKRQFKVPEAHKLRHIDTMNALQHMIDSTAMPGGMSYEDYLRSCLAPEKNQINSVHEDKNPFKFEVCDNNFNCSNDLKNHIESVHEDKNPFKCDVCVTSFSCSNDLKNHIDSIHEDKSPFKCDACDSVFTDSEDLKNHIDSVHEKKKEEDVHENDHFEDALNDHPNTGTSNESKPVSTLNHSNNLPTTPEETRERLNPICKSIWLGTEFKITECPRAHPPQCANPDCRILDQGLPRWKILQCRSWHGQPKSKVKPKKNSKYGFSKSKKLNSQWPPLPSSGVPVWQNHNKNSNFDKNPWFQSHPTQSSQMSNRTNQTFSGNEAATWSTPLSRAGNSNPILGDLQRIQKRHLAMEVLRLMSLL